MVAVFDQATPGGWMTAAAAQAASDIGLAVVEAMAEVHLDLSGELPQTADR
jgi:hypothetical protein